MVRLTGGDALRVTAAVIAEAAAPGDRRALAILRRVAGDLARGIAHAATLLGPRRIILGGGVSMTRAELWLGPIRDELNRLVFPPFRGRFDVVLAALAKRSSIKGPSPWRATSATAPLSIQSSNKAF